MTVTLAFPVECAPVVQVSELEEPTFTLEQLTPPTETVAPKTMPVPEIVRVLPPAIGPSEGEKEVIVGAGCEGIA